MIILGKNVNYLQLFFYFFELQQNVKIVNEKINKN
jgi:hypothetical protein